MEKANENMLNFKEKWTKKRTRDSRVRENIANDAEKRLKTGRRIAGNKARRDEVKRMRRSEGVR